MIVSDRLVVGQIVGSDYFCDLTQIYVRLLVVIQLGGWQNMIIRENADFRDQTGIGRIQ